MWEATGPRTAAVTLRAPAPIEGVPFVGEAVIRGTVEVAADGLSFTAPYTLEMVPRTAPAPKSIGVTTAKGTRITIEQMGDPEGTLAELEGADQRHTHAVAAACG